MYTTFTIYLPPGATSKPHHLPGFGACPANVLRRAFEVIEAEIEDDESRLAALQRLRTWAYAAGLPASDDARRLWFEFGDRTDGAVLLLCRATWGQP